MPGPLPVMAKYAKKPGWFQCVIAGQDDAFEVREDVVEAISPCSGALRRKRPADVTRARPGEDGIAIGIGEVVGDPVGNTMGLPPERLRIHVAERCGISCFSTSTPTGAARRIVDDRARGSVAALRSPDITTAVPPAAPRRPANERALLAADDGAEDGAADGRAANLARAVPGRRVTLAIDGLRADRQLASRPTSTRVWKRTPSRARSLILPPRSTSDTVPSAFAPAGIATRPSAITSRVTRASTRSSSLRSLRRQRRLDAQADRRRTRGR